MPKAHKKQLGGMWDYLDSVGVLEKGTDAEIKAAKKAYRKQYFLQYKRCQRAKKPEYTINFKEESGEHGRIVLAAEKHHMTIPQFLKAAILAYLERKYVVPNRDQVAFLEQALSSCLNEIQAIARKKERSFWDRNDKLESIEKRIVGLENEIDRLFRKPPLLQSSHDY